MCGGRSLVTRLQLRILKFVTDFLGKDTNYCSFFTRNSQIISKFRAARLSEMLLRRLVNNLIRNRFL